jgi:hypothetical protein
MSSFADFVANSASRAENSRISAAQRAAASLKQVDMVSELRKEEANKKSSFANFTANSASRAEERRNSAAQRAAASFEKVDMAACVRQEIAATNKKTIERELANGYSAIMIFITCAIIAFYM